MGTRGSASLPCIPRIENSPSYALARTRDRFELVYSTLGAVYGAGYTADHVNRIALWVMLGASAALGVLLLFNYFRPRLRLLVVSFGA